MTEVKKFKYWFIEDEEGNVDGFESLEPCTAEHVKDYMRINYQTKVTPYATTRSELYLSDVDIY